MRSAISALRDKTTVGQQGGGCPNQQHAINQTRPRLGVLLQVWSGGHNNAINFYISLKIRINSMFSTVGLGNDFRHFFENSNPLHVPHCTA